MIRVEKRDLHYVAKWRQFECTGHDEEVALRNMKFLFHQLLQDLLNYRNFGIFKEGSVYRLRTPHFVFTAVTEDLEKAGRVIDAQMVDVMHDIRKVIYE